ncbi:hypothetical protein [Mycobacteroides abscessus]|uniref:hypothetical protein n=1 Tax=Mycobacteroides abscessus TaxID=36809 RepID=UPI0010550668|nr:hypothetical protein [Mycobacteroides abscessus]
MKMLVVAAMVIAAVAGCGSKPAPSSPPPRSDAPKSYDEVNAPIAVLIEPRQHCFRTGVEAVTAQLRAAGFVERDTVATKAEYEKAGKLLPSGFPLTVGEVEDYGTCYMVRHHGLM